MSILVKLHANTLFPKAKFSPNIVEIVENGKQDGMKHSKLSNWMNAYNVMYIVIFF